MFYDDDIFEAWERPPTGLSAFLIWLRLWWELFWEEGAARPPSKPMPLIRNRKDMRGAAHDHRCPLPPARNLAPYRVMGRRGLRPAQFLERLCRLSLWGRVFLYGLPRRRKFRRGALKRNLARSRAMSPSAMSGGVWEAHLWPS